MPHAQVTAYSAAPDDDRLRIKIVCRDCDIEWGWSADTPSGNDRLDDLADLHNRDHHGYRRVF